jgi:hypothetical protein
MSLDYEIFDWDGKSVADIRRTFQSYSGNPEFIHTVVKNLRNGEGQNGAGWLLKSWFESGETVDAEQTSKIIAAFHSTESWETRLHMLQCLPYLTIPHNRKFAVEDFVRDSLKEKNKFVRAWAYNGLYELAKQHPEYQAEATALFEVAIQQESASVKARIRNILKKGF